MPCARLPVCNSSAKSKLVAGTSLRSSAEMSAVSGLPWMQALKLRRTSANSYPRISYRVPTTRFSKGFCANRANEMETNMSSIGMIETKGLAALVCATDAMLKAAKVQFKGWKKVGSGLCTTFVTGDVASVKAAVDAGAAAARSVGEVVSVHVIARPHDDLQT